MPLDDPQEPPGRVLRVGGDQEAHPSRGDNTDAPTASVDRSSSGGLREVPDDENGGPGALSHGGQGVHGTPHSLVPGSVHRGVQEGHQRVQEDQGHVVLDDGVLDRPEVARESQMTLAVVLRDARDGDHPFEVRPAASRRERMVSPCLLCTEERTPLGS